jgi:endoglucanase
VRLRLLAYALLCLGLIVGARAQVGQVTSSAILFPTGAGLFGVNISGPEFNPTNFLQPSPWPTSTDCNYLGSKGVPFVRLAFAWENIQSSFKSALTSAFLTGLQTAIGCFHAAGVGVIVDLHNFCAYVQSTQWNAGTYSYAGNSGNVPNTGVNFCGDGTLTTAVFADVWTRLATALVGTPGLIGYDIMNEPMFCNFTVQNYAPFAQAAINAIRAVDTVTTIYVEGVGGPPAADWTGQTCGAGNHNNTLVPSLTGTKLLTSAHQYFDSTPVSSAPGAYSGNYASYGQNPNGGVQDVTPYVSAVTNAGWIGEFAWPNDSTSGYKGGSVNQWMTLGTNTLNYLATNKTKATWWLYSALSRFVGVHPLAINPVGGVDDPRLTLLVQIGRG